MQPWPIPVRILPDELLSSWLIRCALAHGCDPLVLTGEIWPGWRAWTVDMDRGLSHAQLDVLQKMSGQSRRALIQATLDPTMCAIGLPLAKSTWPWLLGLGTRNRRRSGGLQCCPLCLGADRKPYFRIQWRLAWHTGCEKHQISLIDRCPCCQMVVSPHLTVATNPDLGLCVYCQFRLTESINQNSLMSSLAFQAMADQGVATGFAAYGTLMLPLPEWLTLARYFMGLIRKVAIRPVARMVMILNLCGVSLTTMAPPATALSFEMLPVSERTWLLAATWAVLGAGLERFSKAALESHITRWALFDHRGIVPSCLDGLCQSLPERTVRHTKEIEFVQYKPRSEVVVMRKWARLQRKLLAKKGRLP